VLDTNKFLQTRKNKDASLIDKDDLTEKLQALIAGDHEVAERWITDAELDELFARFARALDEAERLTAAAQ